MATTEDIEARLAAYIDGELDAAGRAEIERHLTSNPQHRKLIEELARHRDFLRALPRVRAPMDVAENVNAHLERAALLGDDEEDEARILRINHWPQIKAMAAVLLLVFSLAAVVYYVVSSPEANDEFARAIEAAPTRPEGPDTPVAPDPTGSVLTGDGMPDTEVRPGSTQANRTLDALAGAIPPQRGPLAGLLPPRGEFAADLPSSRTPRPDTASTVAVGRQVVIAVQAPDPFAAQRNLERYLVSNSIPFTCEPAESMPEPLKLQASNIALGSRHQQVHARIKDADEPLGSRDLEKSSTEGQVSSGHTAESAPDDPQEGQVLPPGDASGDEAPPREETQADQPQTYYLARNLTKAEVDSLYATVSDHAQGQVAQMSVEPLVNAATNVVEGELADGDPRQFGRAARLDPTTAPADRDPIALTPVEPMARSTGVASEPGSEASGGPTTQPNAWDAMLGTDWPNATPTSQPGNAGRAGDERLDVVILFRSEPHEEAPPPDAAEADDSAQPFELDEPMEGPDTPPAAEPEADEDAPATQPDEHVPSSTAPSTTPSSL